MSECFTKKSLNAANENIQKRVDVFVPRSCVIVIRRLSNNCRGSNIIQNMANYLAADEFWGYMSGKLSGNKGNWSFQSPTQFFLDIYCNLEHFLGINLKCLEKVRFFVNKDFEIMKIFLADNILMTPHKSNKLHLPAPTTKMPSLSKYVKDLCVGTTCFHAEI